MAATISRPALLAAGALTACAAFAVGFGLAVTGDGEGVEVAEPPTTTTAPTTTAPTTTAPGPTTVTTIEPAPATTAAPEPPTTVEPWPPVPPQVAPTTVVTAPPPPPPAPARLQVAYPQDSAGRLVMQRGGTATLVVTNLGGSLGQWLMQSSGYVQVVGRSSGTLTPGASVAVTVRAAPDVPPSSPQGSLTFTGPDQQVVIQVIVL